MLMRVGEFAWCADGAAQDALQNQLAAALPANARIIAHGWRPWASASFVGARYWFDVRPDSDGDAAGGDAAEVARVLARRAWQLPGRFVADVAVHLEDAAPGNWRIELLSVDD